jgi:hypothetical protein
MDFVTKCGLTLNLVVYGSLFSASLRTDLGMEFATKSGTPFFAPQFDADAGIALYSVDSCRKCPSVKLVGSAFVNKVLLDVSSGHLFPRIWWVHREATRLPICRNPPR